MADLQVIEDAVASYRATLTKVFNENPPGVTVKRVPLIITCRSWEQEEPQRLLIFSVNPSSYRITMSQRKAVLKVRAGTLHYYWKDPYRDGTTWDEPTIQYNFQSGNIRPVRYAGKEVEIPKGVSVYHEFLDLLNTGGTLASDQRINMVKIYHTSNLYPFLLLEGWFKPPEGMQTTESAEGPPLLEWTSTFVIKRMTPDFLHGGLDALERAYVDGHYKNVGD